MAAMTTGVERVLSFTDALTEVLHHAKALPVPQATQSLPLDQSLDRVLAEPVQADRDQPPFHRSTRDGFALRASDLGACPRVIGLVRAGDTWRGPVLVPGQAVEIMTGAPLPDGADAVIMLEHVTLHDAILTPAPGRSLRPGENFVPRAAEANAGDAVLPPGRRISAAEIAIAASCGCAHLNVFAQPKVAIVATGDELVDLDAMPEPWQIRNSNTHALAALVGCEGASAHPLPIARDTLEDLRERIAQAREHDLLLLSGGVSMGKYDLVEQVLREFGAEFFFTGVLIQPGKPIVFGRLPATGEQRPLYFFGLPGNPVSTQVCFHLFVAPLLRALLGQTALAPRFVEARLADDVRGGAKVTRFLPAELIGSSDAVTVRVVGWQGSGDLAANARANAYALLPAHVEVFHAGDTVRVLLR